jgi:hypothetical protein
VTYDEGYALALDFEILVLWRAWVSPMVRVSVHGGSVGFHTSLRSRYVELESLPA